MYNVGIAYLLWLFSGFGVLGFHRFYLRKYRTGIIWMVTGGFFFVGALYDFFTLRRQVEDANLRENQSLRDRTASLDPAFGRKIPKDSIERVILKLAKTNKAVVSASALALEANIPLEEAKENLDKLTAKGFVELQVTANGAVVYVVPDMMDSSPLTFER
jgi:hypothetical protein